MVTRQDIDEAPKTILAASTGGHLEQLIRLSKRLRPEPSGIVWVTPDEPQSRSLLAGQEVYHLRYVPPRRADLVLANSPATHRLLKYGHYDRVVSTGAAMALSVLAHGPGPRHPLPLDRELGAHDEAKPHRADRRLGPGHAPLHPVPVLGRRPLGLSGVGARRIPAVHGRPPVDGLARRVVVTFGTQKGYSLPPRSGRPPAGPAVVLAPDAKCCGRPASPTSRTWTSTPTRCVRPAQIREAMAAADLVIAHAGVGSALTALDQGRAPVLLPRLHRFDEMVDDHQLMIAAELESRGLAVSRAPEDLTADDLRKAMGTGVATTTDLPPFELVE